MANIELISLSKTFPGRKTPVLDGFTLTINSGELVALLGPSGSGKSTLLKLIAGIESPEKGEILFEGKNILQIPPNKRGAIFMFQKAYLFPFLNVADNIGFGLKVQGSSSQTIRAEVAKMLDLIGLPGIEKRKPVSLSGGEQQRVALARALILKPQLMLLDEPLNSLDTAVRLNLQEAIRRIQRKMGITTILVTHDLNEAMGMSDRMALLLNGRVAAINEPMKLFQEPPSRSTAQFVGISTFFKGKLTKGRLNSRHGSLVVNTKKTTAKSVMFAIRPENIMIQTEPGQNSIPGVIKDCMYRGEYIEYKVELKNKVVRARIPMPAKMFPHQEQVHLVFPSEHLFQVNES